MKTKKELFNTQQHYGPIVDFVQKIGEKKKLLEIGADDRIIAEYLPKQITYHSSDITPRQKNPPHAKHTYCIDLDAGKLPIKDNSYDIVLCLETLEHVMRPKKVLKEIQRICKPGGTVFISMPNEYNFLQRFYYLIGRKTFMDEPFEVVEKHLHIHKPRVKDILSVVSEEFEIVRAHYVWQSRASTFYASARVVDSFINFLARLSPGLFSRTVVVHAKKRDGQFK